MEKLLLLLCAASALSVVSSLPARQYYFIYEQKTWTEARSYCREKFTDLATVDSLEDVETLRTMADLDRMVYSSFSHRAWIGFYDDANGWRWSMSGGDIEFRNWAENEPDNYMIEQLCVKMKDNGRWYDTHCGERCTSVCANVTGQDVSYVFVNERLPFSEAQSYCREHYTDLVSVRSMAENQEINGMIPEGEAGWIGLFKDWKWSDGSNSSFTNWAGGEPGGHINPCTAVSFGEFGKWEDWTCGWKRAFICYDPAFSKQVVKVKVKLEGSSSLDLDDAAVQEALLQQLKLKLEDQEVLKDVKLSWRKQTGGKIFHKEEH